MRLLACAVLVAGCWSAAPAPEHNRPPPPPPVDEPAGSAPAPTTFAQPPDSNPVGTQPVGGPPVGAQQMPPAPTCGKDQVFETICGSVAHPPTVAATCGSKGDSLIAYGKTRVALTFGQRGANDPTYRDFDLDGTATDALRRELVANGYQWPGTNCCYSSCTQLVVAAKAPAAVPPKGFHVQERCIPPPAGGTSAPAKSEPSCPAAVRLQGMLARYRGPMKAPGRGQGGPWWWNESGGKSCCYEVVAPIPRDDDMGHCPTCKCAAGGTLVMTPNGEVAIERLAVGDLVLSMDRGELRSVAIAEVRRTPARDHVMVTVTLDNGRTVSMSPLHPTADGGRFAELVVGARLGDVRVVAVKRVPYTQPYTYDLLPASDTGTYIAAGSLVGSTLFVR